MYVYIYIYIYTHIKGVRCSPPGPAQEDLPEDAPHRPHLGRHINH